LDKRLVRAARGRDYRAALKAIARLRGRHGPEVLGTPRGALDEQSLIFEIGQFLDLWAEEPLVEVGLAALNDSHAVQSRAVLTVRTWLLPAEEKHLRSGKAEAQRRSIAATYAMRRWVTPEQRARMTRAYAAMLWKHRKQRYVVLDRIVESLGYTACASDADVIEMLEALRPQSGETHQVSASRTRRPGCWTPRC